MLRSGNNEPWSGGESRVVKSEFVEQQRTEQPVSQAPETPSQPPDGGALAWMQCLDTFCIWFAAWGLVNSFGVFQAYYEDEALRSTSSSKVSWVGSLQLCLFIAGTSITGPIFDMGLGMTCLFVPCVAVLPPWFSRRRALAMDLGASGSSIGQCAIVFTIIFQQLRPHIGFAWATRVIAFIVLVSLVIPVMTMRKRLARLPTRAFIDKSALQEPTSVLAGCSMFFLFAGLYIPYFYVQVFSGNAHIMQPRDANLNKYLIVSLNAGSFFGRLFPHMLADQLGPLNTIVPCTALTSAVGFAWIAVSAKGGMITFCFFYGFFSGSVVSLTPVVWASLCPDMKVIGTRTGMMTIVMAAGLLVGNPIAGSLVKDSSYVGLQALCGAAVLAGSFLLLAARVAKVGWVITVKA